MTDIILPQRVRWGPNDGHPAGIRVWTDEDETATAFIPWTALVSNLERMLLPQVFAKPDNYTLKTFSYQGKQDWLVRICDTGGNALYGVWFGGNPNNNWVPDGLIHIGDPNAAVDNKIPVAWQTWQRYSDGSYRLISSKSATLDEKDRGPLP